jgi:hypothetical protein
MGNEDKYAQYPERPSDSRVRYFDGQFLGSQDFIDEQRYHIDRLRRLTGQLRVRGVTDGLGVSATGVLKVKIEAGTAIDDRGRQLVLGAAREVALPADLARPAQHVLCVVFAQPTDRTMGGTGEQKGTRGDTRFRDDVTVSTYGLGKAAPEGSVALALLTVDAAGAVVVSAPADVRVYSGLRLGGPGSPTLSHRRRPAPEGRRARRQPADPGHAHRQRRHHPERPDADRGHQGPRPLRAGRQQRIGPPRQQQRALRVLRRRRRRLQQAARVRGQRRPHPRHDPQPAAHQRRVVRLRRLEGANKAEICNDTGSYKQLMVVGNGAGGAGRVVGIWDHLNVAGRARVATGISINNATATRALQIGGLENGIGMDASDASPNAGYIRFGDNTGWRLHFARAKDSAGGGQNQGPGAALMTVHDSGQVSIGTVNWSNQVRLRLYTPSAQNQWIGRLVAGGDNSVVIAGEWNKQATLGAHSAAPQRLGRPRGQPRRQGRHRHHRPREREPDGAGHDGAAHRRRRGMGPSGGDDHQGVGRRRGPVRHPRRRRDRGHHAVQPARDVARRQGLDPLRPRGRHREQHLLGRGRPRRRQLLVLPGRQQPGEHAGAAAHRSRRLRHRRLARPPALQPGLDRLPRRQRHRVRDQQRHRRPQVPDDHRQQVRRRRAPRRPVGPRRRQRIAAMQRVR